MHANNWRMKVQTGGYFQLLYHGNISYKLPRSKLLPCPLPLLYTLGVSMNSRGGGKSDTGKTCAPALGGGEGTVNVMSNYQVKKFCMHRLFLRGGCGLLPLVVGASRRTGGALNLCGGGGKEALEGS